MLQNSRVTAFTAFELLREIELKGGGAEITHLKRVSKNIYQYSFFHPSYYCLMQMFQELLTNEVDSSTKIVISIVFY